MVKCFLRYLGLVVLSALAAAPGSSRAETIELVTYYPTSFSGEAERLHVRTGATVGNPYSLVNPGYDMSGALLVADRLGIGPVFGTTPPAGALHVVGVNDALDRVLFMPGADTAAAGTPEIRVGIGTANPQALLDIQHPQDAAFARIQGTGDATNFSGLELRSDEAVDKVWQIAHKQAAGLNDLHVNYFDGAAWSTKVAIQPGGNVGIGITAPERKLDVYEAGGNSVYVKVHNVDTGSGPADGLYLGYMADETAALSNAENTPLRFDTNNLERMRIAANGKVGIGTADPPNALTVVGPWTASSGGTQIRIHSNGNGFPAGISGLGLTSQNGTGEWIMARYDNAGGNGGPNKFTIGINGVEDFLNITPAGNVAIGSVNPGYKLDVAGQAHATGFPTSSDIRLKTGVVPLTGVLEKLDRIRPVAFDWNETYKKMGRSSGHREIGVVAQDVEQVFPELVTTWGEENYRAVDYGRFTAVLLEAVKELKAQNNSLEDEVRLLREESQQLKEAVGSLKKSAR